MNFAILTDHAIHAPLINALNALMVPGCLTVSASHVLKLCLIAMFVRMETHVSFVTRISLPSSQANAQNANTDGQIHNLTTSIVNA